jgi:hypothetical protein
MKTLTAKTALSAVAIASLFALSACKVEKTQDAELPKVEVATEGGQMPKFDVETGEVTVGTRPATIEVPTAEVTFPSDREKADRDDDN